MLTSARFVKWRAALMELSVQKLKLNHVTALIPDGGDDPYQMLQTHDYLDVSFFRMDPAVKAASKETIQTLSMAYPELLAHKYFVNVPFVMGWMYAAMKLFLAPATLRKFHPMTSGKTLAGELPSIADSLPREYGGKGPSVKEVGQQLAMTAAAAAAPAADKTEAPVEEPTPAAPAPAAAVETPVAEPAVVADKAEEAAAAPAAPAAVPAAAAVTPEATAEAAAPVSAPEATAEAAAEKAAAEKTVAA